METIENAAKVTEADKNGQNRQITPEEARRAYKREWCRKNPEKVKASRDRFYKKLADKMNAERSAHGTE